MMLRCITQFDVNYTQGQLSTESQDLGERMEADEEAEAQLSDHDVVAISDDEEEEPEADDIDEQVYDTSPSIQDQNPLLDQEVGSIELPSYQHPVVRIVQSDSQRPHRERKRRRDDDEYVYTKRSK
jgi:hypothetical protein